MLYCHIAEPDSCPFCHSLKLHVAAGRRKAELGSDTLLLECGSASIIGRLQSDMRVCLCMERSEARKSEVARIWLA